MRLFVPIVFALITAVAVPAFAGQREDGGRGFDPSGPDAAMLEAANEAGRMVNTNQATVDFQTQWDKTHDQNGNPQPPGSPDVEPKRQ